MNMHNIYSRRTFIVNQSYGTFY